VILPPNTTSRLRSYACPQPCDAGIIATVKSHYRKRLVRHVLAEMDTANTATELSKRVDIMDAIGWLWLAWCSVSSSTIIKCFARYGFVQEPVAVADEGDAHEHPGGNCDRLSRTTWKHCNVYRVKRGCPRGHTLVTHWSKNALLRNLPGESKRASRRRFSACVISVKSSMCSDTQSINMV